MKRIANARHSKLGVEIMVCLDAIKEKLETQRDEARAAWMHKARSVPHPSAVKLQTLLEVDDGRRAYVIAQAQLDAAILMWIAAEEVYENGSRSSAAVSPRGAE